MTVFVPNQKKMKYKELGESLHDFFQKTMKIIHYKTQNNYQPGPEKS